MAKQQLGRFQME